MKIDPFLSKAIRYAKIHDYTSALKILESEEGRYSGSFNYYYLYAVICLHSGDFGGAFSNFKIARQIKQNLHNDMRDTLTTLGFAALYLKRMDTVKAVNNYLEVQENDPKNKIAKKALAIIRKHSDTDSLFDYLTPQRLAKLYPPIPSAPLTPKMILGASLIAVAVSVIVFSILVKVNVLASPFKTKPARITAEFNLTDEEKLKAVEIGGSYRYILTRNEAIDTYNKALSLFTEYRDETAKINLNHILESNASEVLKNKARLLKSYTEVPGFDNFRKGDNFSYSQVKSEPVLYRDVHVIWAGMATNVEITDEFTRFDFLVGYDTRRTLEGIVPVVFYSPVAINTERPLEVLGKIEPVGFSELRLDGVAIHQSGRLEQ